MYVYIDGAWIAIDDIFEAMEDMDPVILKSNGSLYRNDTKIKNTFKSVNKKCIINRRFLNKNNLSRQVRQYKEV